MSRLAAKQPQISASADSGKLALGMLGQHRRRQLHFQPTPSSADMDGCKILR